MLALLQSIINFSQLLNGLKNHTELGVIDWLMLEIHAYEWGNHKTELPMIIYEFLFH